MQSAGRFATKQSKNGSKSKEKFFRSKTFTQIKSYLLDFHFLYSPIHSIPRHKIISNFVNFKIHKGKPERNSKLSEHSASLLNY